MTSEAFFNALSGQYKEQRPFVAYRKPGKAAVKALLQKDATLHQTSEYTESGFVFAPFHDSEPSLLIPSEHSVSMTLESGYTITDIKTEAIPEHDGHDEEQHKALVQKGIEAISNGQFQKVVLSRCETIPVTNTDPFTFFRRLLTLYPTAFVYCWFHPETGMWLGATPEILLSRNEQELTTMALAGTQSYEGTMNANWTDKEMNEQQIVTDYIVNTLKPLTDSLTVSEVQTVRAGGLLHLRTDIKAIIESKGSLREIIRALHPTPAVCGLPKTAAKQFIIKQEHYKRAYYTGFLGELNVTDSGLQTIRNQKSEIRNQKPETRNQKPTTQLFVNLRCMKLQDNKAFIYVGGGITKDSKPENEWKETVHKTKTMKHVIVF